MVRIASLLLIFFLAAGPRLLAVENAYSSSTPYNESAPTASNITNWQTGWTQPAGSTTTTGWDYVGIVNGSLSTGSGVYLGNGWVITCAHVSPGAFILTNGVGTGTYTAVANSQHSFYASNGTGYDFTIFQINSPPNLPLMPLRTTDPVANSSYFALIGYGDDGSNPITDSASETWGYDKLTYVNESVTVYGLTTNDFETLNNSSSDKYEVISGDSGGADFIYNSSSSQWELAGLNEAALDSGSTQEGSAYVQLDTYASLISAIVNPPPPAMATPTMPQWALILLGGLLCLAATPKVVTRRK